MPDARLLIAVFTLIVLLTPAFAQNEPPNVQKLVIGVSPASQTVCAPAGGRATAIYMISTNIDITQNVTVASESEWISGEKNVYVTRTLYYPLTVSVPAGTPEGEYDLKFKICRMPDEKLNESLTSVACLLPSLTVNVSSGCPGVPAPEKKPDATYAIIFAVLVLAAALVLRQLVLRQASKPKKPGPERR
ncbi:MAG: hypothetical protein QXD77_02495 [Candidatus Aenigmatarchaeota archaeon]